MNTRDILLQYSKTASVQQLIDALKTATDEQIYLEGVVASGPALILAGVFAESGGAHLAVLPDKESALYFKNDLENLLSGENILFLGDSFVKPYDPEYENALAVQERIESINALRRRNTRIVVSYTAALAELVVEQHELENNSFEIGAGQKLDLNFVMEFLESNGFHREDFTFEPGQFSIRGGILDLYSYAHENPFRLELDGDIIESIRSFDPVSQLSMKDIAFFTLVPNVQEEQFSKNRVPLFSYLDPATRLWIRDESMQSGELEEAWKKLLQGHSTASDLKNAYVPPHPRDLLLTAGQLKKHFAHSNAIYWGSRPEKITEIIAFEQSLQPLFHKNFDLLSNWLGDNTKADYMNLVFSESSKQVERLLAILADIGSEAVFQPVYQGLAAGFVCRQAKACFITEHQLFDKYYRPRSRQRFTGSTALTLRELKNLKPGDFVTHIDHGIGKFSGLEKMDMNGVVQEVVRLLYKDNDLLYVSVNSLHKIAKYTGKDGTPPVMHKLGSATWEKQKRNTKKKVKDIARELIQLYARRKAQKGFSFAPDNYLQLEMEASFFYEDTLDQAKATEDVKKDMENSQPMDRLVCGDVGFGKTEVAMRAAFKAVCDSKQVAVLVPTTILAQQHYRTFSQRFNGFPVNVEYINRFKSAKQQADTLKKLVEGKVDVIIGTHRLLGKDVKFKDLGLMVIDEEQKFGVSAKEKLKELRVNVDSLTLTATPIPRTLHFSLMGARDLSIINTAPPNRQSIHTELHIFNREVIMKAIQDEVKRSGQVFFIHSKVKDIHEIKYLIETHLPHVRVGIAHGQLEGHELEDVMVGFIEGEFDVLVATTIIESGLDIPNANTIIINNAHMFGLSDLHQMRGRVGRSNVRAYCFLLSPPLNSLSDDARKRLRTIEEFNELGSGFQVAMRDLDIRGAGNLLGGEQSGFISEMGFEMYQKILDEAVRELKHEEFADLYDLTEEDISSRECQIETDYETLIPSEYVVNISERLSLYTELANINTELGLQEYATNMKDRFGKLPHGVVRLIDTVRLKWAGKRLGMEKISLKDRRMKLFFPGDPNAAIYQSEYFTRIMQFVADNPTKFNLKQTGKALILTVAGIEDVFSAMYVLDSIEKTSVMSNE